MDFIKTFTITPCAGSEVSLTGEIPFAELTPFRPAAVKHLGKNLEIDGFRKGHVPEIEIVKRVGEMAILSEMAERTLAKVYPAAVTHHKLQVIGYPQIEITKIAKDNPLAFKLTVAVLPDLTLPDYKKIAKDVNKNKATIEVTDEDVDRQVADILRQKVAYERLQQKAQPNVDITQGDLPTPETAKSENETHTHDNGTVHASPDHAEPKAVRDDELPTLTDELVKTLGKPGQFETVTDFKAKLREHLTIEKERETTAAHRVKITDTIINDTKLELPHILIDSELKQMFAQMEEDLKRANLSMDDYLGHIKKTRDDLSKEWSPAAEKRAKLQLVLNEIAKIEKIEANKDLVDAQVIELKEQYKDADENRVRIYVESVLINEAVMSMLEEQSDVQ